MSLCLGIDCSSVEMGLGLYCDGRPAIALSRHSANSHAEHITQAVAALLASQGVTARELDAVGIAVGPGSFTGLRIGMAFLKGLAFRRAIRILPVSSLESVALAWPAGDGSLVAAFDARRGDVFWARFYCEGKQRVRRTPDALCDAQAFAEMLRPEDIVLADTMGYARSTVFDALTSRCRVYRLDACALSRGLACAAAAAAEAPVSPRWTTAPEVMPVYLRASYAEQQRSATEAAA